MKKTLAMTSAVAALLCIGLSGAPAQAAAMPLAGVSDIQARPIVDVRMSRLERRRMMRKQRAMRRYNRGRSSQAGNARYPSRPPGARLQGQTTGGPRY